MTIQLILMTGTLLMVGKKQKPEKKLGGETGNGVDLMENSEDGIKKDEKGEKKEVPIGMIHVILEGISHQIDK